MTNFKNKTAFITGASRGIGKSIALELARDGANIVIAAKTTKPHPKLEGTIYSAAEEIERAGGKALPVVVDVRNEEAVINAVEESVLKFGGIDMVVNNASAINLSSTEKLDMKKFDLMHSVNVRATFMVSKYCIPHLKNAENPHILNLSPPLNMNPKWFGSHLGYTMSKYGMSMCVLGLSEELKDYKIAVNALWPKTIIATAAVKNLLGGEKALKHSRTPKIVASAAYAILKRNSKSCTGNFFIDENVLKEEGVSSFEPFVEKPGHSLQPDLFIDS